MFQPFEPSPRDGRRQPRGEAHGSPLQRRPVEARGLGARLAEFEGPPIHGAWLVAPMMLLALSCALRLASRGKDSDFTVCFALLLGLGVVWIGLRLCLPPPAPPQCPHCRRSALVRLQAQQNRGARCLHCGWRDETADGRLLQSTGGPTADLRGGVQSPRSALAPRHGARQATGPVRSASRPPRGGFGRGRRLR